MLVLNPYISDKTMIYGLSHSKGVGASAEIGIKMIVMSRELRATCCDEVLNFQQKKHLRNKSEQ